MYKALFTATGLFAIALGILLLVAPAVYLSLYTTAYSPAMDFPAQRLAPVTIGVGGLLLLMRDMQPGPFAARFATLVGLVWFGVAATGVFHFTTGPYKEALLVAAGIEVALGLAFLLAARHHKG